MKTPSREMAAKAEEQRSAQTAKIARLRALRLAKEAVDRDALQSAAPPPRRHSAVRPRRANEAT
jgi:hypothetical protein